MTTIKDVVVGVIGGSGVYRMDFLRDATIVDIATPFGKPSDSIVVATVDGVKCAFIPRHGRAHSYLPTEVPYRANIYALKSLGARYLVSITAVGALRAELSPGDVAVVTQLIDKTVHRRSTFFGEGVVAHVPFGNPTCEVCNDIVYDAIRRAVPDATVHRRATLVTIEGPAFSTVAESRLNATVADLVGMTTATESKLCREAEMAHCCVAMVTDQDAWAETHVTVSEVMKTLSLNGSRAQLFTREIVRSLGVAQPQSEAFTALNGAIMTDLTTAPQATVHTLELLLQRATSQKA